MKKLLFLFLFFASAAQAQTTFCLSPSCPQKVLTTDTARIFALLSASDGFKSIAFTQIAGPSKVTLGNMKTVYVSGQQATTSADLSGQIAGTYVFTVIGTTNGGTVGSAIDSITIVQAPPPCPAPRTVKSFSVQLVNGLWIPSFIYSDGTTQ